MDATFHDALADADLAEGQARALILNGWPVLLCRTNGAARAVINRCTHADSQLSGGRIRRGSVICPDHGAIFNLETGVCAGAAGYGPLKVFATRVMDGRIAVAVPDTAPGPGQSPVGTPRPG